jgi:hypothetical protein
MLKHHSPAKSGHSIKKKRKKESSKNWGTATFLQAEHAARKRRYQSENTCVARHS